MSTLRGTVDEFLDTSLRALGSANPERAMDTLGWWELLDELADPTARLAVFALFRAQGRLLADTAALGALMAQPYLAALERHGLERRAVVAAVGRGPSRAVVVGPLAGRSIIVDRPGVGATLVEADKAPLTAIELPGRQSLCELDLSEPVAPSELVLAEPEASMARARSLALGRVAIAAEIGGAAEGALALAVGHAVDREQFGQPIAKFQAVRHLLAWAQTDCVAIEAVVHHAVGLDADAGARFDQVAKAVAGRNGRRVCERSLQVLGGIGFTNEHGHHHFHSRVLALDALAGTSAELISGLGAWLRESGGDPGYVTAALATTKH